MTAFGDIGSTDPLQIWDGVAGWTAEGDRVTLALIELEADSVVPEHSHENEQVGILLKGSMRFSIGGEVRDLQPGATWSIPANTPHDVVTGPEGATLVEVFAPGRADWSGLERVAARRPLWPPLP